MQIEHLFDPSKNIYRRIEKVISYAASAQDKLRAEISEYVVTDSIEQQLEKLLDRMDMAMGSGENEVGVWVSGFYGSGKSSFTKYLGFAFDDSVRIDGIPFLQRFQDRLQSPQVKAQISAVAKRYPATVIMIDLAGNMLAGASKADVSSVLYFNVLQWAGYSRNLKIAALERKIKKDNRWEEFEIKITSDFPDLTWKDLQNDPLIVDGLVPKIAHEMYPALFPTDTSFNSNTSDFQKTEEQQVEEMLEIIREKTGKEHIIFIVDEVGQYVASGDHLILNLDGLAKNLKRIGDGKVWIVSTAQQTLTEDDARAAINAASLYKLKDRFPIQIDLDSRDIKEICVKRLLGKSPAGEEDLGKLFDSHGAALRLNTKLQDARHYDAELDRKRFVDLYPFLPAHFEILLQLLGALAKSTGGFGLRSAIKVIQDILIEETSGKAPVAKENIGWLATSVTLFDALDKEIQKSAPQIYSGLVKTRIKFPQSKIHEDIAKTIVILQILNTLPVTVQNIAALLHPSVDGSSLLEDVRRAVDEMLKDSQVPLSEKDGDLYFLSAKLNDIEKERGELPLFSKEVSRLFNENLRNVFDPLPQTILFNSLTVRTGIKVASGNSVGSLAGEQNPVQTVIELVSVTDYEATKLRLTNESSQRNNQNTIFLLGVKETKMEELAAEIYRCQRIVELHKGDPDQEVKGYRDGQQEMAARLSLQLQQAIKQSLQQGTFIFRGSNSAVTNLDSDLSAAAKKYLGDVAGQVFDRYNEAPERVETTLAEKLLKIENPSQINSVIDPLGLFEFTGGTPTFKTDHPAVISIRDYIKQNGAVEGKRLIDHFSAPRFGWSPDTLRYIIAAMLLGGEIKLTVSAREVTTIGQQAIEALKTNRSFHPVGVKLREERPSIETLARAAERLTNLIGETIVPIEQEISRHALKKIQKCQSEYAPLGEKFSALNLPGSERIEELSREMQDVIDSDGAEAINWLGSESSEFYENLQWSAKVKRALSDGLENTLKKLQVFRQEKESLPESGVPGILRQELADILESVEPRLNQEDFFEYKVDFNSALTDVQGKTQNAVKNLAEQIKKRITDGKEQIAQMSEWQELTQEERDNVLGRLDDFKYESSSDLAGFKQLLSKDYDLSNLIVEIKENVRQTAKERLQQKFEAEITESGEARTAKITRDVSIKSRLTEVSQLEELIRQLQEIKNQIEIYPEMEINIVIED